MRLNLTKNWSYPNGGTIIDCIHKPAMYGQPSWGWVKDVMEWDVGFRVRLGVPLSEHWCGGCYKYTKIGEALSREAKDQDSITKRSDLGDDAP